MWWHKPSHLEQYTSRTHRFAWHSSRAHTNIFTHRSVTPSTSCSSSFSSIRTWVSLGEMTALLKASVVFFPNRLPMSCAPGSSSTLRLVGKLMFKVSRCSFVLPDINEWTLHGSLSLCSTPIPLRKRKSNLPFKQTWLYSKSTIGKSIQQEHAVNSDSVPASPELITLRLLN